MTFVERLYNGEIACDSEQRVTLDDHPYAKHESMGESGGSEPDFSISISLCKVPEEGVAKPTAYPRAKCSTVGIGE